MDAFWAFIRDKLNTYARPFLVKVLTRYAAYVGSYIFARLGVNAPAADMQGKMVDWAASAFLAVIGLLIDYAHHRLDRKDHQ